MTVTKTRIRRFFYWLPKYRLYRYLPPKLRYALWTEEFDDAHHGRFVDGFLGTVFLWDVHDGYLYVYAVDGNGGIGPCGAYARLDVKRPKWHYM